MITNKSRENAAGGALEDTAMLPALKTGPSRSVEDLLDNTDSWQLGPEQQHELEREAELGTLRSNLASMAESRGYLENSLRSLTMNLRDLEERLLSKSGQTATLEADLRARVAEVASLRQELDVARGAEQEAQQALLQLGQTLASERQDAAMRQKALRAQHEEVLASVQGLRSEMQGQLETIRSLNEQLEQARREQQQTRAELNGAEERIRAGDIELRNRDSRIEQLGAAESAHKARAENFARRLAERDDLIQRLEQEAESSVAVLEKIHSNLSGQDLDASALPRDSVVRLLVRHEGNTEVAQVLGRRTLIGRGADCQMRIDADFVSRRHALVQVGPDATVIEDLNSTNGVYVNGVRIARRKLADGDEIAIGRTVFRYVLKPAAERGN